MATRSYTTGTCTGISVENISANQWFLLSKVPNASIKVTPTEDDSSVEVKNAVTISITCFGRNTDAKEILSQSYMTNDNYIELVDLVDIMKSYLSSNAIQWCQVALQAKGVNSSGGTVSSSVNFFVFYEVVNTSFTTDDLTKNFMLSHNKRILFKDAPMSESLYWYMVNSSNPNESVGSPLENKLSINASCLLTDGTAAFVNTVKEFDTQTYGVYVSNYEFKYEDILEIVQAANSSVSEIKSFRLEIADRTCSYMVVDEFFNGLPLAYFCFRNEFGFSETLALPGVTKAINDVSQSEAISGHTRIVYDKVITQSFEFQSAALPTFMEKSILSLVCGEDVKATDKYGNVFEVVITDYTDELTDELATTNSVKLTYKYKSDIPVKPRTKAVTEVFNDVYDNAYG